MGARKQTGALNPYWKGGHSGTPEHEAWMALFKRCNNPKHKSWKNYGGRGIKVCDRWSEFEAFLADMGRRPTAAHSIDRKDNDGDYEPGNCRWATKAEQRRNQRAETARALRLETAFGQTKCLTDWSREYGVHHATLSSRLRRGWSLERSLVTPPLSFPFIREEADCHAAPECDQPAP